MNLYEILQNSDRVGEGMTHFERLFAQKVGGGKINEISGVPPLRYIGDGRPLTDYLISGNTDQDCTPSPDAPVDVVGCGVRTGNLWDEAYPNIRFDTPEYRSIFVGDGEFTLSTSANQHNLLATIFFLSGIVTSGASSEINGVWKGNPRTVTSLNGYVTIAYRYYTYETNQKFNTTMLNYGSTPLPYEPYGYKLPLTVNGTEYPIYLGQVETTRRVKKLVLDGTESSWGSGTSTVYLPTAGEANTMLQFSTVVSSHYIYHPGGTSSAPNNSVYTNAGAGTAIWFKTDYGNDVNSFKAFLAQEYAAGHPVTVWYVLAAPETAVVNEPLMKIVDYADTVSFAQTGVTIPTVNGENVLDVPTTVPPSEVWIRGKIKEV